MKGEYCITCFSRASTQKMDNTVALKLRLRDLSSGLFLGADLTLADFKPKFIRLRENEDLRNVFTEEFSTGNCRLTHRSLPFRVAGVCSRG